jgi:hypothetical protein
MSLTYCAFSIVKKVLRWLSTSMAMRFCSTRYPAGVMKLILTHNFSQIPDASNNAFEESVYALLLADQNLFGGAHRLLINTCAVARGLLTKAKLLPPKVTAPRGGEVFRTNGRLAIAWKTIGDPPNATHTLEYNRNCVLTPLFDDDAERGANSWTVHHSGGTLDWSQVSTDYRHECAVPRQLADRAQGRL